MVALAPTWSKSARCRYVVGDFVGINFQLLTRFRSFVQRKLLSEEYKDVDEQYRVAMIKLTTTKTAAEDLKKYGNALDKVS